MANKWSVSHFCFFFFSSRRRHTRFDCDWSSDVCSSDLVRRRIRDISHGNKRWIVTLVARRHADGVWRGRGAFFPGSGAPTPELEKTLAFQALELEEIAAQNRAGSPAVLIGTQDPSPSGRRPGM